MPFSRTENSPFEDTSVLAEDFIPERVLGRDDELEQIEEVWQQIVDVEEPVNAFIYGISGTGKTVSIRHKQRELEQSLANYDDVHATFVYQNCESLNSSYQAAIAMVNSYLKQPEYDFLHDLLDINREVLPSSGLPTERVYSIFFSVIDELTYRNTEYRAQIEEAISQDSKVPDSVTASHLLDPPSTDIDLPTTVEEYFGRHEDRKTILSRFEDTYDIRPPSEVTDYVVVILDEVDRIGTHDEILYEIPRSRTNNRVENVHPSVIGISNDVGYKESIQSKTDSSLRLKEITFSQYDANQLEDILRQRAQQAYVQEDINSAVSLAAAYAKQEGGDARYGIDLLYKAGIKAKKSDETQVTDQHIRQAHEEAERDRVYEVTEDLSEQEKIALAAVMYHDLLDETPIERKDLYPTYRRFAADVLRDSNSSRMVAEYLKKMSQLGLLRRKDSYDGPGESGFVYDLEKVDYDMIMRALGPNAVEQRDESLVPSELAETFNSMSDQDGQTSVEQWSQSDSSS